MLSNLQIDGVNSDGDKEEPPYEEDLEDLDDRANGKGPEKNFQWEICSSLQIQVALDEGKNGKGLVSSEAVA
ncbi:hypothetical protein NQZ68_007235 [Dissostichus eleginoides]|nr:hypothetical protein NQZ68_007235 [Dissostichus eleginoides]